MQILCTAHLFTDVIAPGIVTKRTSEYESSRPVAAIVFLMQSASNDNDYYYYVIMVVFPLTSMSEINF